MWFNLFVSFEEYVRLYEPVILEVTTKKKVLKSSQVESHQFKISGRKRSLSKKDSSLDKLVEYAIYKAVRLVYYKQDKQVYGNILLT